MRKRLTAEQQLRQFVRNEVNKINNSNRRSPIRENSEIKQAVDRFAQTIDTDFDALVEWFASHSEMAIDDRQFEQYINIAQKHFDAAISVLRKIK